MAKWAFTQFDVPAEGNIVDIGCRGGFNIKRLLDKSAKDLVYGVDISDVSVEKSKAVNKRHIGKRCEIYKGSADKLPFENNFIDPFAPRPLIQTSQGKCNAPELLLRSARKTCLPPRLEHAHGYGIGKIPARA